MKMKEVRWDYKNATRIREDVKDALISCTRKIMHDTAASDEIKLAMLDGVWELYNAIIPHTEKTEDEENVQNS